MNITLLKLKTRLNIMQIEPGENDRFNRHKETYILASLALSLTTCLGYAAAFFLQHPEQGPGPQNITLSIAGEHGDLRTRITLIHFNELGQISAQLNAFIQGLSNLIAGIQASAGTLQSTSEDCNAQLSTAQSEIHQSSSGFELIKNHFEQHSQGVNRGAEEASQLNSYAAGLE